MLYESMAGELGVPLHGPAIKVLTGAGRWVEGRAGVLPEMRLGSILIRHMVVLVLPDRLFPPAKDRSGVDRREFWARPSSRRSANSRKRPTGNSSFRPGRGPVTRRTCAFPGSCPSWRPSTAATGSASVSIRAPRRRCCTCRSTIAIGERSMPAPGPARRRSAASAPPAG
ncbi:MAG: retropepsin-like domain-containing protein [Ignavibacteriales bacterium]|nr:retropepsin-like domain-containing protein [Ignavibacteriales bacterium]